MRGLGGTTVTFGWVLSEVPLSKLLRSMLLLLLRLRVLLFRLAKLLVPLLIVVIILGMRCSPENEVFRRAEPANTPD